MKRPSFQFYPSDWQANSNLRRCTHAEKGAWLDVMCLLHDQPEYGQIRWPLKEVAQAIGATPVLLRGLVTKGVLKGDDSQVGEPFVYTPRSGRKDGEPVTLVPTQAGPLWYSSRMVKDEYVRTIRGDGTRFGDPDGADPKVARKAAPKPPFGDGPSSSSSSSTSVNTPHTPEGGRFAEFWNLWPTSARKVAKVECEKRWKARKLDEQADQILAHVAAMRHTEQWTKGYEPAPLTYLNQRRWEDGAEEGGDLLADAHPNRI